LFKRDAEKAHERGVAGLQMLSRMSWLCRIMEHYNLQPADSEPVKLFGLEFKNRVGLAAGMDKNAACWPAAAGLGFGHVEIGTVTYHKQPGNPRPRVFRFPEEEALINRMGFNNEGAEFIADRLNRQIRGRRKRIPLGINLGKSKIVPLDEAHEDYVKSFNLLAEFADYIAINVSSPNTPDLRKLQGKDFLPHLLGELMRVNKERARKLGTNKLPMLLKIAPDLTFKEIDQILETIQDLDYDGIIATNTTLARPGSLEAAHQDGGLSGKPLRTMSTQVISYISKATDGKLPIIGVGGIMDAASAGEKLDAGASLVQLYTGFVYRGPFFPGELARCLSARDRMWL